MNGSSHQPPSITSKDITFDVDDVPAALPKIPPQEDEEVQEDVPGGISLAIEDFPREDFKDLVVAVLQVPSLFYGKHLQLTPEECDPVVDPLQRVLVKYEVDFAEILAYLPELSLVMAGAGVYACMSRKNEEHKKLESEGVIE